MTLLSSVYAALTVAVASCSAATGHAHGEPGSLSTRRDASPPPKLEYSRFLPPLGSTTHAEESSQLVLDNILLVASVDGRFHALNRTTGRTLWSMAAAPSESAPATMLPLIRTHHAHFDPDLFDDDADQEQYIIEPQSGDIYVLSSPNSPLQRLPFSMPQLVDMSPFSFTDADDRRTFIGRKETSLLLIELETGKVKATINSECPWEPVDEPVKSSLTEIDLDELEESELPIEAPRTEVYIGRTDYYMSIHTRPMNPSSPRPPVQNLSFSVYGPNNQDLTMQSIYRRTADDTYVQSLPSGQIIAFKTVDPEAAARETSQSQIQWGHAFPSPIVAVFDVLHSPHRTHPFILLQPHARLQDLLPNVDVSAAARADQFENFDGAYVGLVDGSLFAMSPNHFPLVVFSDASRTERHTIDGAGDGGHGADVDVRDLPVEVDAVTEARRHARLCQGGSSMEPRCLTGVRQLDASSRSSYERLLEQSPAQSYPSGTLGGIFGAPSASAQHEHQRVPRPDGNASANVLPSAFAGSVVTGAILTIGNQRSGTQTVGVVTATLLLLFAIFWMMRKKMVHPTSAPTRSTETLMIVSSSADESTSDVGASLVRASDIPASSLNGTASPALPSSPAVAEVAEPKVLSPTATSPTSGVSEQDVPDGDESGKESGDAATSGKRKPVRRRRGKKKKAVPAGAAEDGDPEDKSGDQDNKDSNGEGDGAQLLEPAPSVVVLPATPAAAPATSSLVITEEILGFGSHGTVVYKGSLQGRAVAVKRLLRDFVTLASREVDLLQESDDHPNVIRYYYQEAQSNFLYIALELCPASLADVIERPDLFQDISISFNPKRALQQVTSGLRHLHALKIIHRDIKPQNILISAPKKGGTGAHAGYRMLISDFGLCKKLEMDQTSFLPTVNGAMAVGTVGWRAPEILRGEVNLEEGLDDSHSQSSRGSVGTVSGLSTGTNKPTRLTKSVDIFALGCLFYYTLTHGGHPFGDRYEREVNILKNVKSLDGLERFGEEGSEAVDLITSMLDPEASARPDTGACLIHPYFWEPGRRLTFLQDGSDRFEIMCRDPRDPMLIELEGNAVSVVGNDWHARLDKVFVENLGKFRKYDGRSVQDLMRALRNKKHHYQDLPDNVKRHLGPIPEGFLAYFTRRFPRLFLHVYGVVAKSSLRQEPMFRSYFELQD